ncbi:hypothetical protein AO498_08765 [Algoriphagus sanaruensis]|uniref:Uncharacterized protein n=1 Tax=Algoriphagus sanaruensis TaxID=1727163 RepID=A0A142EN02_9BACT|nr:hypothetical protein AO498_08765 [Algoriphagus sanaruensis]
MSNLSALGQNHSVRIESTGLDQAARNAWNPTVSKAKNNDPIPAQTWNKQFGILKLVLNSF